MRFALIENELRTQQAVRKANGSPSANGGSAVAAGSADDGSATRVERVKDETLNDIEMSR